MQIIEHADLNKLCTFKIGGAARFLVNWQETSEIAEIINFAKIQGLPLFVFGGGSNLLFPDTPLNAVVIRCMTKVIDLNNGDLYCDAGVRWPLMQSFCKNNHLYGLENFYGLPGTIGGAVAGNAGCHGQEIKDVLTKVDYFDITDRQFNTYIIDEADFAYRHSIFKTNPYWLITGAYFRISDQPIGDTTTFAEFRATHQPQGLTTGSFFKNPYPQHAGKLLDEAGLKGVSRGGVSLSEKHANFVINDGTGTAKDVISLTEFAKETVKIKFGIELESEVKIVTEADLLKI